MPLTTLEKQCGKPHVNNVIKNYLNRTQKTLGATAGENLQIEVPFYFGPSPNLFPAISKHIIKACYASNNFSEITKKHTKYRGEKGKIRLERDLTKCSMVEFASAIGAIKGDKNSSNDSMGYKAKYNSRILVNSDFKLMPHTQQACNLLCTDTTYETLQVQSPLPGKPLDTVLQSNITSKTSYKFDTSFDKFMEKWPTAPGEAKPTWTQWSDVARDDFADEFQIFVQITQLDFKDKGQLEWYPPKPITGNHPAYGDSFSMHYQTSIYIKHSLQTDGYTQFTSALNTMMNVRPMYIPDPIALTDTSKWSESYLASKDFVLDKVETSLMILHNIYDKQTSLSPIVFEEIYQGDFKTLSSDADETAIKNNAMVYASAFHGKNDQQIIMVLATGLQHNLPSGFYNSGGRPSGPVGGNNNPPSGPSGPQSTPPVPGEAQESAQSGQSAPPAAFSRSSLNTQLSTEIPAETQSSNLDDDSVNLTLEGENQVNTHPITVTTADLILDESDNVKQADNKFVSILQKVALRSLDAAVDLTKAYVIARAGRSVTHNHDNRSILQNLNANTRLSGSLVALPAPALRLLRG